MKNQISESIFSNGRIVIPMADVQHIEEHKANGKHMGVFIITKQTKWNFEYDMWENPIYLSEEEEKEFNKAWCHYRYEKDIKPTESNPQDSRNGLRPVEAELVGSNKKVKGYFHKFVTYASEEGSEELALIELEEGTMIETYTTYIKFLDVIKK